MTVAFGVALLIGAAALSLLTCTRSARSAPGSTGLSTLWGLLAATVIACAGASLVASATASATGVVAFAAGAGGVALPVLAPALRTSGHRASRRPAQRPDR